MGDYLERGLLIIKPDGVVRGLIGEVISRIEERGFKITGMKLVQVSNNTAKELYKEHKGKPFYEGLISYITSIPVVAMVIEGEDVIKTLRNIAGKTNPAEAAKGTIRGDFGLDTGKNVVHASDSKESARREISIFFKPKEILSYEKDVEWPHKS